jgi:hypothetical protein
MAFRVTVPPNFISGDVNEGYGGPVFVSSVTALNFDERSGHA